MDRRGTDATWVSVCVDSLRIASCVPGLPVRERDLNVLGMQRAPDFSDADAPPRDRRGPRGPRRRAWGSDR